MAIIRFFLEKRCAALKKKSDCYFCVYEKYRKHTNVAYFELISQESKKFFEKSRALSEKYLAKYEYYSKAYVNCLEKLHTLGG